MASIATNEDVKRPQRSTRQSRSTTVLPALKTPRRSDRIQKKANGPALGSAHTSQDNTLVKDTKRTKDCGGERLVGIQSEAGQQTRDLSLEHTLKQGISHCQVYLESSLENTQDAAQHGSSQESDPIRPAKRRRTGLSTSNLQQILVSARGQQPPSNHKSSSIVADSRKALESRKLLGVNYKNEIEDSYEEGIQSSTTSATYFVVEIPIYEDFNRDAYSIFSISSQSTATSTTPKYPRVRSPIRVIPDSQDQSFISNYESFDQEIATQSAERGQKILPEHFDLDENEIGVPSKERKVSEADIVGDSSSVETWQGSQIPQAFLFSNSQSSSGGLDFDIFKDSPKRSTDQAPHFPQELSQGASDHSALSQLEPNSQLSTRDTDSSHSQKLKGGRYRGSQEGQSSKTLKQPPHPSVVSRPSSSESNRVFPSRPPTLLESNMAHIEIGRDGAKLGYIDELRAARNKVRATFKDSHRLPPIDPEVPPASSQTSDQKLPMRENITDPAVTVDKMDETADDSGDGLSAPVEVTLRLLRQRPMENIILLPIVSMVREIYESVVMKRKHEIQEFLSNEKTDPTLVKTLDAMIEELKLLVDHQDLITMESSTQLDASDEYRAKWATTCSSKCSFIHSLLEEMRQEEKHIAILVRPGRMLDILESILRWYKFPYERINTPIQPWARGVSGLKITLIPTGLAGKAYRISRPDAVIVFDETFREADRFSTARELLVDPQTPPPLMSLVVAYSVEHIELCLSKTADLIARKKSLVDFVTQTRDNVGKLDAGFPAMDQAVADVAKYLHGNIDDEQDWPLPEIPDITGLRPSSIPVTQNVSGSQSQQHDTQSSGSAPLHGPMKRPLGAESITESDQDLTKRMRMTPTPGEVSSGDVTRVSDSVGSRSQMKPAVPANTARDAITHVMELNSRQSKQITNLVEKVGELEAMLLEKQSAREHLLGKIKDLEQRLDDHISTIKKLQPRLQEAVIERGKFQEERDEAKAQAASIVEAITSRNTEMAKLKQEKTRLEKALVTARTALASSALPEAAAFAQAQDQARALQSEKVGLQKRISGLQNELNFAREVYQKASSHTTQIEREVADLRESNAVLQRKASENMVRIAEIQRSNEGREREARIAELEALLRDREAELRKKSEELKVKTNGRRETRGTSVPRSPRMGTSRVSPRPSFARVAAAGSRGASPAPGDYAHTRRERDPTQFTPSNLGNVLSG